MNNKYLKRGIIFLAVLILIAGIFYFVYKKNNPAEYFTEVSSKADIMTESERNSIGLYHLGVYEVLSRDENGNPKSYRLISLRDEDPIDLEFMSDAEKSEKLFNKDYKIQVLERDETGKITAYKIIRDESDIVKKY